jgi:hypothetical protein
MYGFLLVCRPGSKKDECKSRLQDKEGVSLCGGGSFIAPVVLRNPRNSEQTNQDFINLILLECLRLAEARQKCKDASSYQPTIY